MEKAKNEIDTSDIKNDIDEGVIKLYEIIDTLERTFTPKLKDIKTIASRNRFKTELKEKVREDFKYVYELFCFHDKPSNTLDKPVEEDEEDDTAEVEVNVTNKIVKELKDNRTKTINNGNNNISSTKTNKDTINANGKQHSQRSNEDNGSTCFNPNSQNSINTINESQNTLKNNSNNLEECTKSIIAIENRMVNNDTIEECNNCIDIIEISSSDSEDSNNNMDINKKLNKIHNETVNEIQNKENETFDDTLNNIDSTVITQMECSENDNNANSNENNDLNSNITKEKNVNLNKESPKLVKLSFRNIKNTLPEEVTKDKVLKYIKSLPDNPMQDEPNELNNYYDISSDESSDKENSPLVSRSTPESYIGSEREEGVIIDGTLKTNVLNVTDSVSIVGQSILKKSTQQEHSRLSKNIIKDSVILDKTNEDPLFIVPNDISKSASNVSQSFLKRRSGSEPQLTNKIRKKSISSENSNESTIFFVPNDTVETVSNVSHSLLKRPQQEIGLTKKTTESHDCIDGIQITSIKTVSTECNEPNKSSEGNNNNNITEVKNNSIETRNKTYFDPTSNAIKQESIVIIDDYRLNNDQSNTDQYVFNESITNSGNNVISQSGNQPSYNESVTNSANNVLSQIGNQPSYNESVTNSGNNVLSQIGNHPTYNESVTHSGNNVLSQSGNQSIVNITVTNGWNMVLSESGNFTFYNVKNEMEDNDDVNPSIKVECVYNYANSDVSSLHFNESIKNHNTKSTDRTNGNKPISNNSSKPISTSKVDRTTSNSDTEIKRLFNISILDRKRQKSTDNNIKQIKKKKTPKKKDVSLLDFLHDTASTQMSDSIITNTASTLNDPFNFNKSNSFINKKSVNEKTMIHSEDDEDYASTTPNIDPKSKKPDRTNLAKNRGVTNIEKSSPPKKVAEWRKDPLLTFQLPNEGLKNIKKENDIDDDLMSVCSAYQDKINDTRVRENLKKLFVQSDLVSEIALIEIDDDDDDVQIIENINMSDEEDNQLEDAAHLNEESEQLLNNKFKKTAARRKQKLQTKILKEKSRALPSSQESDILDDRFKDHPQLVLHINPNTGETIKVDSFFSCVLKEHQKRGLHFMWDTCFKSEVDINTEEGTGCILAHAMGVGKSVQIIALLHTLRNISSFSNAKILILSPKSLINNWEDEIRKWTRKLETKLKIFSWRNDKIEAIKELHEWSCDGGVYLLGRELFNIMIKRQSEIDPSPFFLNPGPDVLICDEAHLMLKNEKTETYKNLSNIRTKRRILLTGTPVQNNLGELYNLVKFAKTDFMNKIQFRDQFIRPIAKGQDKYATPADRKKSSNRISILHNELETVMDREQGSNQELNLPAKLNYDIFLNLSPIQNKLIKHFNLKMKECYANPMIFNAVRLAENISIHPKTLENTKRLEDHVKGVDWNEALRRGMDWHEELKGDWWKNVLDESELSALDSKETGIKVKMAFKILKLAEEKNDKVLMFCSSLEVLNVIEHYLEKELYIRNVNFFRLDGSVSFKDRKKYLDIFNDKKNTQAKVFLLTHKVGGIGLNFSGANRVIIFDMPWNPAHHEQSSNRTHRIGQTKASFVYRLITKNTLEEKIYKTTVSKQSLSKRVVDRKKIKSLFKETDIFNFVYHEQIGRKTPLPTAKDDLLNQLISEENNIIHTYHEQGELFERSEETINDELAVEEYIMDVNKPLRVPLERRTKKRIQSDNIERPSIDAMLTPEHIQEYDHFALLSKIQQENSSMQPRINRGSFLNTSTDLDNLNKMDPRTNVSMPYSSKQQPPTVNENPTLSHNMDLSADQNEPFLSRRQPAALNSNSTMFYNTDLSPNQVNGGTRSENKLNLNRPYYSSRRQPPPLNKISKMHHTKTLSPNQVNGEIRSTNMVSQNEQYSRREPPALSYYPSYPSMHHNTTVCSNEVNAEMSSTNKAPHDFSYALQPPPLPPPTLFGIAEKISLPNDSPIPSNVNSTIVPPSSSASKSLPEVIQKLRNAMNRDRENEISRIPVVIGNRIDNNERYPVHFNPSILTYDFNKETPLRRQFHPPAENHSHLQKNVQQGEPCLEQRTSLSGSDLPVTSNFSTYYNHYYQQQIVVGPNQSYNMPTNNQNSVSNTTNRDPRYNEVPFVTPNVLIRSHQTFVQNILSKRNQQKQPINYSTSQQATSLNPNVQLHPNSDLRQQNQKMNTFEMKISNQIEEEINSNTIDAILDRGDIDNSQVLLYNYIHEIKRSGHYSSS